MGFAHVLSIPYKKKGSLTLTVSTKPAIIRGINAAKDLLLAAITTLTSLTSLLVITTTALQEPLTRSSIPLAKSTTISSEATKALVVAINTTLTVPTLDL